eukprot:377833-Prymnesium_polylepis.1
MGRPVDGAARRKGVCVGYGDQRGPLPHARADGRSAGRTGAALVRRQQLHGHDAVPAKGVAQAVARRHRARVRILEAQGLPAGDRRVPKGGPGHQPAVHRGRAVAAAIWLPSRRRARGREGGRGWRGCGGPRSRRCARGVRQYRGNPEACGQQWLTVWWMPGATMQSTATRLYFRSAPTGQAGRRRDSAGAVCAVHDAERA